MERSGPTVAPTSKCAFCRVCSRSWVRKNPWKNRCSDRTEPGQSMDCVSAVWQSCCWCFCAASETPVAVSLQKCCMSKTQQVSNWGEQYQFLCVIFATTKKFSSGASFISCSPRWIKKLFLNFFRVLSRNSSVLWSCVSRNSWNTEPGCCLCVLVRSGPWQQRGIMEGCPSGGEKQVAIYFLVQIMKTMLREYNKWTDDSAYVIEWRMALW